MAIFEALVEVQLRPGFRPSRGHHEKALPALGFAGVSGVRAGKAFACRWRRRQRARPAGWSTSFAHASWPTPLSRTPSSITGQGACRPPGHGGGQRYRGLIGTASGVVVFPGTNCEHDVVEAFEELGAEAELVWHGSASLGTGWTQ